MSDGVYTLCAASSCEASEVCQRHGACTAADGLCVVRAPVKPDCTLKRVYSLKATASSVHAPEATEHFDASFAVDRDVRTMWAPDEKDAIGATLTIQLPKAEKVAQVQLLTRNERDDPIAIWSYFFTQLVAVKVSAGDTHEVGYFMRWGRVRGKWMNVNLPPTETDRVQIEILATSPKLFQAAPSIPEVFIEACE